MDTAGACRSCASSKGIGLFLVEDHWLLVIIVISGDCKSYISLYEELSRNNVNFNNPSKNITVFDAYPKSIFHFLILPRIQKPDPVLSNLGTLLNSGDKVRAKEVITSLWEDAQIVKKEILDEMDSRYGFKWDIWIGFHGAPSMEHLHLHVLSSDLLSEKMKNKKHYNSFHPKLGFFLDIQEVLEWLDAEPTFFSYTVKTLKPTKYEPILKEPLACFRCNAEMKNIPLLKKHLEEEWDKLERRGKESASRKRKAEVKDEPTSSGNTA